MVDYLTRVFAAAPFLVALALILKFFLIEPYSVTVLQFEVEFDYERPMKKGDKGAI